MEPISHHSGSFRRGLCETVFQQQPEAQRGPDLQSSKFTLLLLRILGCALSFPFPRVRPPFSRSSSPPTDYICMCTCIFHCPLWQALGTHIPKIHRYPHIPRPSNQAEHRGRNHLANEQCGCGYDRITQRCESCQRRWLKEMGKGGRGDAGCGARSSPFNSTIRINVFMSLPSTMKGRSPSLNTVIQNALHKCNKTISFHLYIQILNYYT